MYSTEIIEKIKQGKIGVIPTDTIYGLVGSALMPETVEKIYSLRERDRSKAMIILIASIRDLEKFQIELDSKTKNILQNLWPGKVSVILPCPRLEFEYLHRGNNSLAFRIPDFPELQNFLEETGPLVAPSANPEGQTPAATIDEAKKYFGDQLNFYVDGGKMESDPSTIIEIQDGKPIVKRQGAQEINFKKI